MPATTCIGSVAYSLLETAATYVLYFFKVSAEPSSYKDQSGDKSKGASSKDDKGAKDDDKAAKDDDKASKDDSSIRDDGKQGKHTFFISPAAIFVSAFLVEPATWIELFSNL